MTKFLNRTDTKTILVSIVIFLIPIMFYFHYFESQTTVPKHIIALNNTYLQSDAEISYLAADKAEQSGQLDHHKWQEMKTKLQAIRMHNTLRHTLRNRSIEGVTARHQPTTVVENSVSVGHYNPRLWTLVVR